jgi:hypothetical protein
MKGWLIDWCLTPTLAIFQLRKGRRQFLFNIGTEIINTDRYDYGFRE